MFKYYCINQKVIIELSEIFRSYSKHYYSKEIGFIKGIKILPNHMGLYLIEFLNYDRIWFTIHRIHSY